MTATEEEFDKQLMEETRAAILEVLKDTKYANRVDGMVCIPVYSRELASVPLAKGTSVIVNDKVKSSPGAVTRVFYYITEFSRGYITQHYQSIVQLADELMREKIERTEETETPDGGQG